MFVNFIFVFVVKCESFPKMRPPNHCNALSLSPPSLCIVYLYTTLRVWEQFGDFRKKGFRWENLYLSSPRPYVDAGRDLEAQFVFEESNDDVL